MGKIRVGEIRRISGLGSVWAQCPMSAAYKAPDAGRAQVDWTWAAIEPLTTRPMRCYRCFEEGHAWQLCTAKVDRSDRCYRCSCAGH